MNRFVFCVEIILTREGGLKEDPDDPGGLTNFGISQRAFPALDIRKLTREGAITLYRTYYWEPSRATRLPAPLDLYLFDSAVNQGVGTAVRLLQKAVDVAQDGVIGPVTLGAITHLGAKDAAAQFMTQRALHYVSLGTFWKFGEGWFNRLFLIAGESA